MKKIDDIWKWGICMGTDIIGGEFLSEYVVREENQSMTAVNIMLFYLKKVMKVNGPWTSLNYRYMNMDYRSLKVCLLRKRKT
jgi:hypothetical protein